MNTNKNSVYRFGSGFLLSTLFAASLMSPAVLHAQEQLVCASVMPCNTDGTVVEPFDRGDCAPMYRAQCLSNLTNVVQEDLITCKQKLSVSQKSLATARKQMRRLREALASKR